MPHLLILQRGPMRSVAAALPACAIIALAAAALALQPADQPAPRTPMPPSPSIPAPATAPQPQPTRSAAPPAADEDDRTELVVHLKDGRRFTGPVVRENASEVVISIAGIPQRFTTDEIDRLEVLEPLIQRYRKLRDAVGDDPEQIVNLAEWLRQRGKYELALTEVQRALATDKTHAAALKLKQYLEEQIILRHQRIARPPAPAGAEPTPAPIPPPPRPTDFPLLSAADIKLIKVYETRPEEHPRILIDRQITGKLLENYKDHPLVPITREGRDALLRQDPLETLQLMFRMQARDFYSQVEVLDQPRSFLVFRDLSQKWLLNSCATTLCHGGMEAGRLILYTRAPNSERTVYSNFYILSKFQLARGTPLINWDEPEKSPLVQLGLPRSRSRFPHPEVPHRVTGRDMFQPVFQTTDDRRFEESIAWIKSLYRPRPAYPIVYTPLRPFALAAQAIAPAAPPADNPADNPGRTPPATTPSPQPSSPTSSAPRPAPR